MSIELYSLIRRRLVAPFDPGISCTPIGAGDAPKPSF